MAKGSKRQFLVRIGSIAGYWATATGGETSAAVSKVYDGGAVVPDLVASVPDTSNLVIGRPFDPTRDGPISTALRPKVGKFLDNITIQPTDANMSPIGQARNYPQALLVRVGEPAPDAASGDPATYELEFAISHFV